MITLVVIAQNKCNEPAKKHLALERIFNRSGEDWEAITIINESHPQLAEYRTLTQNTPLHGMIVLDANADYHSMVYAGLSTTEEGDVLLINNDTNLDTVEQLLIMYTRNSEHVFVRQKENLFFRFFSWLGEVTYNFGLKINGRSKDHLCNQGVQLIEKRVVDAICSHPENAVQIRTLPDINEVKTEVAAFKSLTDTPKLPPETVPARTLGIVSLVYILTLLALAVVYPATQGGVFTGAAWWVFLALAMWIGLGFLLVSYLAKQVYNWRVGTDIVDERGNLRYDVVDLAVTGIFDEPEAAAPEPKQTKTKSKKAETKAPAKKPEPKPKPAKPAPDVKIVQLGTKNSAQNTKKPKKKGK
ncbi:MAG: hypothetical protein FWE53_03770 [Firmicutes bacterium]|nr:hypothetical protein [Bacillota bacterium]